MHREARPLPVARFEKRAQLVRHRPQDRRVEATAHADELRLAEAEARVVLLDVVECLRTRARGER